MKLFLGDMLRFLTDRLFITFVVMCALFYVLAAKLFDLQIANGESYQFNLRATFEQSIAIEAPRGSIYDRLGRPLAVNESAFTLKLDPSVRTDDINRAILDLMELFEKNGETYIDNFPITKTKPYEFDFTGTGTREERWKKDMNIADEYLSAPETFEHLRVFFGVPEEMPDDDARKILSVRSAMYLLRFRQYTQITVAVGVKQETVAVIEEENAKYPGVSVGVSSTRHYPGAEYVSHIIGYIGRINNEEMARLDGEGYRMSDMIGKSGLELSLEADLRGANGNMRVEVDGLGRRLTTLEPVVQPVAGDRMYLTFDLNFQKRVYEILYGMLKEILINRFTSTSERDQPITTSGLLNGIIMSNGLSVKKIMDAADYQYSSQIRDYVKRTYPRADASAEAGVSVIKQVITDGIDRGAINPATVLLAMLEQGVITGGETFATELVSGYLRPYQAILQKIQEDEITPQMVGLDPCSGSVVVTDVATGAVLASVNYPTYDNNRFVNNFDVEYFLKLNNDPTSPMFNRAFMERRAPGSTFKMITAVAGLESGAITPSSVIYDEVTFSKAGAPYLRCWSSSGHGGMNIVQAIANSCNFFFCETAYRMGNAREGTTYDGIGTLNEYMVAFGLNDRTGVEIGEAYNFSKPGVMNISSPQYKEYLEKSRDPDAPGGQYEWYDGDTVATAIGQSKNNYTAAIMVKYFATLASGGIRHQMRFVGMKTDAFGNNAELRQPVVENILQISGTTLANVYTGMRRVAESGTGQAVFADFPIAVGAKTGTAEEDKRRNDHSSFGGFAPFDDPQIAVYVSLPFGNTPAVAYSASKIGRDVIGEYFGLYAEPERPDEANILVR